MKKLMVTMTALASALVLLFPGAATANHVAGPRTVVVPFEFYAIGQGDLVGLCLRTPPPPAPGALQSCAEAAPAAPGTPTAVEDHVEIDVRDSANNAVYFSVQQPNNDEFGFGCGTLTNYPNVDFPLGGFPINGLGTGGGQAPPVLVFPWAGPGIDDALEPGGDACLGSADTNIVQPGTTGTVTFTFHNHVAP